MDKVLPTQISFEVLDFVPLGSFVLNAHLQVLFWNSCLEEWTGIPRQEIIGQRVDHYFPHLNQPKYLSRLDQIFAGGHPILFSSQLHPNLIPVKRSHRQYQVQYTTITAIPGATAGEFYALWSIQDVTDLSHQVDRYRLERTKAWKEVQARKQAETAIAQLAAIVESSEDAIIGKALDGTITSWNAGAEKIFGYTAQETVGQPIALLMPPGAMSEESQILERILQGERIEPYDTQRCRKDGTLVDLSMSISPIKNTEGKVIGASKIARDISDRKQKEIALQQAMEAAEAANLAKSMFLANMSHELRTPLNVILGFSQVMAHDTSLTPSQREDLQTIQRSGDHLLSLINDVLDLSKIEAGQCTLEESEFDLISLLHTLRSMMTERAKAKRLQLDFEIAPEVPQFIVADEQKLRQILLNLLSNAIKFTSQGQVSLRVTGQPTPCKVCPVLPIASNGHGLGNGTLNSAYLLQFEVTDTGVGIAVNEQSTIFNAFVQAAAGKKSVSGTGLGLTISRKLLHLMKGEISVHSMPNEGSTFTFTLPVCPTVGIHVPPEQQDHLVIGLVSGQPHRRILVVDDQRENRLVLVRLLSQLGLEVQEAANGQDAIAIWQEWQPDLTWMDIRMPGLDGYEATRQIRALECGSTSVIIALTAQASQSDRALALSAGCNDYISKPFREETVFLKMAEYLGLEYLYAPSSTCTHPAQSSVEPDPALHLSWDLDQVRLPDRSSLPDAWWSDLEEAAICGDDRAIATLAHQLPAQDAELATQLLSLSEQFQFEQILNFVQHAASD